jgi:hypothetical protein
MNLLASSFKAAENNQNLITQNRESYAHDTIRDEPPFTLQSIIADDQQSTAENSEHSKCYKAF